MIETIPFGSTGHRSTRILFGAAALGGMRQEKADAVLELLLEFGINHIDTAAMYGESELRIGSWMGEHREKFFLATKTGERTATGARDSLHRSLDRLRVSQIDLIQLHNCVDEDGWQTAMGPGGALEALIEAKAQGLVRFLGVTGHGLAAPVMHRRSLERFAFDSVLLPYNFSMMSNPEYAANFDALAALCEARGVAIQTIKSVARRRWPERPDKIFSWYEPLRDPEAVRHAVGFVLARPGLFLNSSSDTSLLRTTLQAAADGVRCTATELQADAQRYEVEPLFVPGGPQGTL